MVRKRSRQQNTNTHTHAQHSHGPFNRPNFPDRRLDCGDENWQTGDAGNEIETTETADVVGGVGGEEGVQLSSDRLADCFDRKHCFCSSIWGGFSKLFL